MMPTRNPDRPSALKGTSRLMPLPWPLDLAGFYLHRKLGRRTIPLLASFKVTHRCNLACRACPFHRREDRSTSMTWETARVVMETLSRLGTRIVIFEGGEPLLWHDGPFRLHDLVREARNRFLRVAVTTNGTLPLDVPAHAIWVSVDGLKETQDNLRSGSFDRIMENLQGSDHDRIFVHCTLNRENLGDIEGLARWARDLPVVKGLTFQFFYPYKQGEDDLSLFPEQRRWAVESLLDLKKRGFPVMNSSNILRAMASGRWRCHDDILINVDPDGSITHGCYAKSRGEINCAACGFTPVAEASGALDLKPGSIYAGWRLFLR
ncbi:MAG: radical SAM protein [Syntrophales bacterium]|nr:radical SAM protein [Syntrophales bacterium]